MLKFKQILIFIGILLVISCKKETPSNITLNLNENWEFKQSDSLIWRSAEVPGCIHTDLLKHKIIKEPFIGTNEDIVQWVENKDWEYKTDFKLSENIFNKEKIDLIFEGLDTYAKVYLNDSLIITSNNMFITYVIECKDILTSDNNQLLIVFKSPVNEGLYLWEEYPYNVPGGYKVLTRKAGFHYGWDWGARLVTSGIWRPVKIHAWNTAKINNIQISTDSISENLAKLKASYDTDIFTEGKYSLSIKYNDKILNTQTMFFEQGEHSTDLTFHIKEPKLWWTNGLGEAFLYKFDFELSKDNKIIDLKTISHGIRTVELVKEKDEYGESFYFKLNNVPVFMKGANYIPQDNFQNRVTKKDYEKLIQIVCESNMNMLRVWGGGIYENDYFYELCDKNGILIWQDFMFACAMYPGNIDFLEDVNTEVKQNIKRLRNHPCIALWCGNNEIDEAWHNWGWSSAFSKEDSAKIYSGYDTLFHKIIPNAISKLDPSRKYHPSSPQYGRGNHLSQYYGDSHYWGIWHDAEPFENYELKVPRFMSEFGFQSFPSLNTIKKFAGDDNLNIDSEVMLSHQKHPRGNKLIKKYLEEYYIVPEDFEDFIFLSQLLQAEGIKLGIEALRRSKPYCWGSLYWQLNDCWPVVSWSSIDYYKEWKALQYFVKKAYNNYLISFTKDNDSLYVHLISDELENKEAVLQLSLIDFKGKLLDSISIKTEIKGNQSKVYYTYNLNQLIQKYDKSEIVLTANLFIENSVVSDAKYYFVESKFLSLEDVNLSLKISKLSNSFELIIMSAQLNKNLYITTNKEGRFSDNFFDLLPNKEKRIYFYSNTKDINLKDFKFLSLNKLLSKK